MEIREMQFTDIPQLAELYRQFWGTPSNVQKMEMLFPVLQKKESHIFLSAVEGEKLVGTLMGIVCEELFGECQPFLVLENLMVDENHRRLGIAKSLLAQMETIARRRGCWQMILVTEADRSAACAFYHSAGFLPGITGFKKKLK